MIDQSNEDQLQVFNKVRATIEAQASTDTTSSAELCRLFVSGCGGTGKSYLIKSLGPGYKLIQGRMLLLPPRPE